MSPPTLGSSSTYMRMHTVTPRFSRSRSPQDQAQPATDMSTSNLQHTERSQRRRWHRMLAVAGVLLLGAELSQARASCGDYLHNGSTTSESTRAGSPQATLPSPCEHGRCDSDPIPTPLPPATPPNTPTDDVTDVEWTRRGHSHPQTCRLDRDLLDPARPGHPVRIDRPPRG